MFIFSCVTVYLLCTGSFYLCYRAKEKIRLPNKNRYAHLYNISVMVYIFIVTIGISLLPSLMKNMLNYTLPTIWILTASLIGILFGLYYVKFEMWLCKSQKSIPLAGKKCPNIICLIVIVIAILEEIMFRGFVNEIAFLASRKLSIIFILLGIVAFGLSHLYAGWIQFLSKTIFASAMTTFYILTGGIIIPAISHAVFNYQVVKKYPHRFNN